MKNLILTAILLTLSSTTFADDFDDFDETDELIPDEFTIKTLDSVKVLPESEFPIAYTCSDYSSNRHAFIIRTINDHEFKKNALLIFPDNYTYFGIFYRDGMKQRFDWKSDATESNYSLTFDTDNTAHYYEWSLADENGKATSKKRYDCTR